MNLIKICPFGVSSTKTIPARKLRLGGRDGTYCTDERFCAECCCSNDEAHNYSLNKVLSLNDNTA